MGLEIYYVYGKVLYEAPRFILGVKKRGLWVGASHIPGIDRVGYVPHEGYSRGFFWVQGDGLGWLHSTARGVAAHLRRALEGGLILVWNMQREGDAKISIYLKTMDQSGWQGDQRVANGTDNDRIRPSVAQVFGGTNNKKIIVVYRNDADKKVYFKWSNEGLDIVKKGDVYTEFSLLTLYHAHFEINGNLCIGVEMRVIFYSYLDDYQAESIIWTGITLTNITLSVNFHTHLESQ